MGSWRQMYAGNLEENVSVPLMEAGWREENVTRERWEKQGVLPSLLIIQQQALCFTRWKMTRSSNKRHRAADVEASPMGRKAMVTLEYFFGCLSLSWSSCAADSPAPLRTRRRPSGVSTAQALQPSGSLSARRFAGRLWSFLIPFIILTLNKNHVFRPPSLKGPWTDKSFIL